MYLLRSSVKRDTVQNSSDTLLNNSESDIPNSEQLNSSNPSNSSHQSFSNTSEPNLIQFAVNMDILNVNLALKIVPEFSGDSSCNLDRFLSCCKIVVEPLNNEEEIKFLRLLHAKLTGKAHEILLYNNFETFEDLKKELNSQFGQSKSVESLTFELVSIKQDRTEDIRSYANRVEKILSMLDSACIKREGNDSAKAIRNLNGGTALRSFEEGLREPIKLIIKACRYKTLKEAISGALEEEIIAVQRRTISQPNLNSNFVNPMKCNICHKTGHLANRCFKRQQNLQNQNQIQNSNFNFNSNSNRPSNSSQPKICNYCKNTGHSINECKKRLYNNNSRNFHQNSNTKNIQSENFKSLEVSKPNAELRVKEL